MVDHVPVGVRGALPPEDPPTGDPAIGDPATDDLPPEEPLPLPRRHTLVLLVGRVTTIKLAFWAAVTGFELALPRVLARPFADRFGWSIAFAMLATALALGWAAWSARTIDRDAGGIPRSVATIATTFAAASVVASPASIPLLLVELRASTDGCPGATTCHLEPFFLWVALFAVGFLVIPAAFAASLPKVNAE